jgi:hypothetical protein
LATVLLLLTFAEVKYTDSDPRGSLLVTESILTHHTIKLDHYGEKFLSKYFTVHKANNHFYYYFPLGTSIISIPFVAAAKAFGLEMPESEPILQRVIAALTSVLTLLFLIKLARLFIGPFNSLIVSSVFWFGTSLASTSGTALWSHNFATLFGLWAIYYSIKSTRSSDPQFWPLISTLLFAAYICRPTMALLSPFVLVYFFTHFRVAAIKAGLLLLALLAIFVSFSINEFGQLLPHYYMPGRVGEPVLYDALYGNLLSPARGLFVYSPFILLVWICVKYSKKDWELNSSWFLIGLVWPLLHLVAVCKHGPHWWAGYCFGARFMTDIMPGLFLLSLYAWPTEIKRGPSVLAIGTLAVAALFAICVNSGQGLFNKYTALWNAEPSIDKYPEYLFDWSYPQFLANRGGHEGRLIRHAITTLVQIDPGEIISHNSGHVIWLGWSAAEPTHRWSSGSSSTIVFVADPKFFEGTITLHAGSLDRQRVIVFVNGKEIYSTILTKWDENIAIRFPSSWIDKGKNTIEFRLPDARQPTNEDKRVLALALKDIQLK